MFVHTGFKLSWLDIFLLPWLFLGIAYLVGSVLYRRYGADASGRFHRKTVGARDTTVRGALAGLRKQEKGHELERSDAPFTRRGKTANNRGSELL